MDGEDDHRRRQTTSKGLNTQVALSLKAALAGEIMGVNEVGVKRAEARPALRRRTPVSRLAMWRNNRLRPGHGEANEAWARVGRPH